MTRGKLDEFVYLTLKKDGNNAMIGANIENTPKLIDS
jgi:hypothetical protein